MNTITCYLNLDGTQAIHINPVIINFDWGVIYSRGFGISYFGTESFGDPE
jgi:hypothetical protein